MIKVEKLTYGFPAKDLYNNISFTVEAGQHCALIGSNGTGKSTLVDMIMSTEKYWFDGEIIKADECRIGYASQFSVRDKTRECTVFQFLSERFIANHKETEAICQEMATSKELDGLLVKYQTLLDINQAMDGDNFESNIHKELNTAAMGDLENTRISLISGGEYKILQIMREMLMSPNLLILDEPDVFLDFGNLNSLCHLINSYKGTILVVTHNRYLLNHCFNKILHLENKDIQEFEGNYTEYRCYLLAEKLRLKIQNSEEQEEIARKQELVDILRKRATEKVNPVIGQSVNAKQTQLDRLLARHIKEPFIEIREPKIVLPRVEIESGKTVLAVTDYQVEFDKTLLDGVDFDLLAGEKVAIVGANGTGKTTLIKDILNNNHPSIYIDEGIKYACLSQLQEENNEENQKVWEVMQDIGYIVKEDAKAYLAQYCLEGEILQEKVRDLSVGEQNLLQIAVIANSEAEFLILDEPTSHLDIYAQVALENAVSQYKGTVLMVSHDFYIVANCANYVLFIEGNKVRTMSTRKFRKRVYDRYFDQKYLEIDKKKQEIEANITLAFKKNDFSVCEKLVEQLENIREI